MKHKVDHCYSAIILSLHHSPSDRMISFALPFLILSYFEVLMCPRMQCARRLNDRQLKKLQQILIELNKDKPSTFANVEQPNCVGWSA